MITVDIKTLLGRLNPFCTRALEGAAGLCVSRTHYEVTVEHVFAKILEEPQSDVSLILRNFDIDPGNVGKVLGQTIEEFRTGNAGKPVFSPLLLEWIQDAWLMASVDLEENRIRSGALLIAFLARPVQLGEGRYITCRPSGAVALEPGRSSRVDRDDPRREAPRGVGRPLATDGAPSAPTSRRKPPGGDRPRLGRDRRSTR
jgi:type VI secretion system protein VasG